MAQLFVLGTGIVIGIVITLPITELGSQALSFAGSTIGAVVTAAIALGALEWDRWRKDETARGNLVAILDQARGRYFTYTDWLISGADASEAKTITRKLESYAGLIRESAGLAKELRATTSGTATVALALEFEVERVTVVTDLLALKAPADASEIKTALELSHRAVSICAEYLTNGGRSPFKMVDDHAATA